MKQFSVGSVAVRFHKAFFQTIFSLLLLIANLVAGMAALPANRDTTFQTQTMDGLPNATIVLPDGKILIAGSFQTIGGGSRRAIARLNADGTIDTSFNPAIAAPGPFGKAIANAMVRQSDGKFIVAGGPSLITTDVPRTNIIRFNDDGTVDPTFNANGVGHYAGLALQADGKIVFTSNAFKPVRHNADGSADASFNYTSGIQSGLFGLQMFAQADGHIVLLAGDNNPNSGGISHLLWLKEDGSKDTAFQFPFPPNQIQDESRFAVAANGTMLVASYDSSNRPQAKKVAPDGTADVNFNYLTAANNQGLYPVPAALLPDGGAILVRNPTAGDRRVSFFYLTPDAKLAAQRDLPNAASDNGVVAVGVLPARAFALQADGKLLFAEAFFDGAQNVFGIFRMPTPPVPALPVITVQPSSQTIGAGESLFLNVTATSESPLTYQWQHATTNLVGQVNQGLNLGFSSVERAGDFVVIVGNVFGSVTSQVATITVRTPTPPVISQQPVGGSVKLSLAFNMTAQCNSEVTPGFQWFKNNAVISTAKGQGTFASMNLPANDANRTGDYFVVFTNTYGGSVTSTVAHLDVILPGPPQFTIQPQDLALFVGQPVQLNASVIADGVVTYQWQRAGTNLSVSATVPSVNTSQLYVNASDANRAGDYSLIAVSSGGSATSRVAVVTLQSSGLPIILTQPVSQTLPFGQPATLSLGFNGEAPLGVLLTHEGANLYSPPQLYSLMAGANTNTYSFNSLLNDAGAYRFIITNSYGSVTSSVAVITVQAPPAATIVADLPDVTVGIGEFNFVSLRDGLTVTNLSNYDTTHILSMTVASGLPPFANTGLWQIALSTSNLFYVGANNGADAATGMWGFAPAAPGYVALALTNFPRAGDVSRLEAFEDGHYGIVLGGNTAQTQAGAYRVLGARRPATNVFSIDLSTSNGVQVEWLKNGLSLDSKVRPFQTTTKLLGTSGAGAATNRFSLILPDVTPGDVGAYSARITNTFPNPDHSFGQPLNIVTSVGSTRTATLSVRGYAETNSPAVIGAFELGSPTAKDEPTAIVAADEGLMLAVRTTSVGGNSSTTDTLSLLTSSGQTNWQTALPAQARAVLPDGQGGAYIGGHNDTSGNFFLNRVRPSTVLVPGKTYFSATNVWAVTADGPSTNAFENLSIPHGAEVVSLIAAPDGIVVAGRFRGKTRFGATNIVVIPNIVFSPVGGTTLTNSYDAAFGLSDGSWDLFLAKYDTSGKIIWARGYGGTNSETLTSLSADAAGNLFLAGSFQGGAAFGSLTIESTKKVVQNTASYSIDGFVVKLAPDGTAIWAKNFGGLAGGFLANTFIPTALSDSDGNVFFVGVRNQISVTLQVGMIVGNRYLARLNSNGDLLWAQTLVTVGNSDSLSGVGNCRLALDSSKNVIFTDSFQNSAPATLGAATLEQRPASGAMVAKFSPGGTLLWARNLDEKLPFADDPRPANARLITVTPTDEVVIAGSYGGGATSGGPRTAGQRFDTFEMFTTDSATINATDVFVARLAPVFAPAAPLLTVLSDSARSGLLQDSISLEGRATGVPAPSYQWLFNGQPLLNATNRVLTFLDLERFNAGSYVLTASNSFGAVAGTPIVLTPLLRPNMTGWTMVTAITNYIGVPARVAADDAGNSYPMLVGYANGGILDLRKFDVNGNFVWRFETSPSAAIGYILSPFAPVVAPSGEVFVAGRIVTHPNNQTTQGNFLARVNPDTGVPLWVNNLSNLAPGGLDPVTILAMDLDRLGHVRLLMSDKTLRIFAGDGSGAGSSSLGTLPVLADNKNFRFAVDAAGGFYFYANRIEALNFGSTNYAALGGSGAQSYVLAKFDAGGALQWSKVFPGPGGVVLTPSLKIDSSGNAVLAGGLSLLGAQTLQIGTNILTGAGYAAKVSPVGDVLWAKAWWLNVRDAAVDPGDFVYIAGWFRFAPAVNGGTTRQIDFGTNRVAGSSVTGHDQFVAAVDSDGHEQFIRQTGGTQFSTFDNAGNYNIAVDTHGVVTTAGFTLVPHAGGALDIGDQRFSWPNLVPYDFANSGGDLSCYYVARLEVGAVPSDPAHLIFTQPTSGSASIQFTWPDGFHLQRRTSLSSGSWETLNVPSPYSASITEFTQGYFRASSEP